MQLFLSAQLKLLFLEDTYLLLKFIADLMCVILHLQTYLMTNENNITT